MGKLGKQNTPRKLTMPSLTKGSLCISISRGNCEKTGLCVFFY